MKVSALFYLFPISLLSTGLAGCGVSETDANRFEVAASRIAAIPLEPKADDVALQTAPKAIKDPLRVELMTPHQLWDARDGVKVRPAKLITLGEDDLASNVGEGTEPVSPVVRTGVQKAAEMAPVLAKAAAQSASNSGTQSGLQGGHMIQLGAYANQAAAQNAWGQLGTVTQGLSPVFEPATVNGRSLVRLKVRAQSAQARTLCDLVAASDSWCLQATR